MNDKVKVIYYIDLIYNLLMEKIQFSQSMARPVIPLACFEKANLFKKLINNILESFARQNALKPTIKTTRSIKDENGNTITEYIADPQRAQKRAQCYINLLKDIKISMTNINETTSYSQRAILIHNNWIKKELKNIKCNLIKTMILPINSNMTTNIPMSFGNNCIDFNNYNNYNNNHNLQNEQDYFYDNNYNNNSNNNNYSYCDCNCQCININDGQIINGNISQRSFQTMPNFLNPPNTAQRLQNQRNLSERRERRQRVDTTIQQLFYQNY